MPPLVDAQPLATDPMGQKLGGLNGWSLYAQCGCGRAAVLPLRRLNAQHGPRAILGDVVARLTCSECRRPPAYLDLRDRPEEKLHRLRHVLRDERTA
ncbi:MAG: hypothetical protein AB1698_19300 [Pseudomonadota bacterium]